MATRRKHASRPTPAPSPAADAEPSSLSEKRFFDILGEIADASCKATRAELIETVIIIQERYQSMVLTYEAEKVDAAMKVQQAMKLLFSTEPKMTVPLARRYDPSKADKEAPELCPDCAANLARNTAHGLDTKFYCTHCEALGVMGAIAVTSDEHQYQRRTDWLKETISDAK